MEIKKRFMVPDQPNWRLVEALAGILFLFLLIGIIVLRGMRHDISDFNSSLDRLSESQHQIEVNQDKGKERSYAQRAINCTNSVLDNDRDFPLTAACTAPVITAYYPQSLCDRYFPDVPECGTKANHPAI